MLLGSFFVVFIANFQANIPAVNRTARSPYFTGVRYESEKHMELAQTSPIKEPSLPSHDANDQSGDLLIGTWVAIALIGSVLVKKGVVARDELLEVFDDAETASLNMDRRHVAMGAVRIFVERIGEAQKSSAGQTDSAR
jgi:hypothetical protein